MVAWIYAHLTFSLNAWLVGGRDFSSGAEVMFFLPIFLDLPNAIC